MAKQHKILIVGPSWVGDLVMAQSLFRVLKAQGAILDVLAPAWNFAILQRMPEVRRAITMPVGHGEVKLGERYRLGKSLREEKYDQAILLTNTLKSALIPFFAKIPVRTGWIGEMRFGLLNDIRRLDKAFYPQMVQRFVALAYPRDHAWDKNNYPYPKMEPNAALLPEKLARFQLTIEKPVLALCPGAAFGVTKRWPAEYYAEIAEIYLARGWNVWLFGSPKDAAVTAEIQQGTKSRCTDLAGKLQLDETVDLLSAASMVVSNDSGLLHVAAALNRPVVAVYGSTSSEFTPPLGDHVEVLSVDLPCRPCAQPTCRLEHFRCMRDVTPDLMLGAMGRLAPDSLGDNIL